MDHPPRARAAGMLHDTFEVLSAVYRHGGKDAMFQFFAAFCAGMVLDDLADLITDLRAVCFWKDADCTKIRPIGIGEALRRRICACIALQDRAVWDTFCTSLLPEDQHDRDELIAECDEVVDGLNTAIAAGAACGISNAEAKAKLVVAQSELETAKAPAEFPVNYSFSKNSAEMTFHHVQAWVEQYPKDHTISDDKKAMFPTASRPALFANLRLRKDHEFAGYVPAFRLLYGKPARIFLVRREGEFRMPRLNLATSADPGECDDNGDNEIAYVGDLVTTGAGEIHEGDLLITPETAAVVDEAVRRWRGWDQGCVLSVFASVYPYHLACHAVCKKRPGLRIVAFVDDTYLGQGPERLYKNFRYFQKEAKRLCDLESNQDKLKAVANSGGTQGIPQSFLDEQKGELLALKVVGGYVPVNAEGAIDACIDAFSHDMVKRLAYLDEVDLMRGAEGEADTNHIRYGLINRKGAKMMIYFQRVMLPAITAPVMRDVVDPRLMYSWELIAKPEGSSLTDVKLWRLEQPLPTSMGGADIGGSERNCDACFASSMLACAPRLAALPGYDGVDLSTLDHGMFSAARTGYDATVEDHHRVSRTYAKFDKQPYHTLRGGKIAGLYRPGKLPRAFPSFADALEPEGEIKPPAQRALTMVQHHKRWLEARKARIKQDGDEPNGTYDNRAMVRFIAASQPNAGAMLDISPDGSFLNTFSDMDLEVYVQRRGGLDISCATGVFDALERSGSAVDRKGDGLACGGEYSRRHHRVLRRGVAMTRAVAIGQVVQGDKEKPELTDMINTTCAVDLAELEGDEATGADVCQEYIQGGRAAHQEPPHGQRFGAPWRHGRRRRPPLRFR